MVAQDRSCLVYDMVRRSFQKTAVDLDGFLEWIALRERDQDDIELD